MNFSTEPWWRTDVYDDPSHTGPLDLNEDYYWGPKGAAMVPLWDDGRTGQGWGRDQFMGQYLKDQFSPRRVLYGYDKGKWNFAWIMRGSRLVCIDIDGKNGGFEHASQLGYLPPTAAETSKSGNGYHLFYLTGDAWDDTDGFALYRDQIGIVTGVDFRGTGCVYHYPTQRWNHRKVETIPPHLAQRLRARTIQQEQTVSVIQKTLELDKDEIAMMHYELLEELKKPIPVGKRNVTLFAIGSKLKLAQVPDWETALSARATEVGLDAAEVDKLVRNVEAYA